MATRTLPPNCHACKSGDFDGNDLLDLTDFADFVGVLTGPLP